MSDTPSVPTDSSVPMESRAPEGSSDGPLVSLARLGLIGGLIAVLYQAGGWGIVIFIAMLLVVIFLHELGHFVMARSAGMKVTEFFIGFGPKLWSFRRGETEYGF
ncbi:MAG: site-2 protease family protein, partial [Acidimicrobiales bacterium]